MKLFGGESKKFRVIPRAATDTTVLDPKIAEALRKAGKDPSKFTVVPFEQGEAESSLQGLFSSGSRVEHTFFFSTLNSALSAIERLVDEETAARITKDKAGWLVARKPSEWPRTTQVDPNLPLFKNLIKGCRVTGPNQVWVADITYIRTREAFMYLGLITDRWSRKIVGYHCGDTLEAAGCLCALEMALAALPAGARPKHHSDRGSQYCCHEYVNRLVARGLGISMTEQDHCAENALAERMNGILKSEYGLGREMKAKEQARRAVDEAVHLYNTRRPHTALNYRFPEAVHSLAA